MNREKWAGRWSQWSGRLASVLALIVIVPLVTGGWWWGSDGNTHTSTPTQPGTTLKVYLYTLGYETNPSCTANQVVNSALRTKTVSDDGTNAYVYGSWYIEGPAAYKGGVNGNAAYQLGINQAKEAVYCWQHEAYTGGITIFGDFESGWYGSSPQGSTDWQANVNVISGFVYDIRAQTGAPPGVYTDEETYLTYFAGQSWSNFDFAWWAVHACQYLPPYPWTEKQNSIAFLEQYMVKWHIDNEKNVCLMGNQGVSLWQELTTFDTDWDLTPQQVPPDNCFKIGCGGYFEPGWDGKTK